MSRVLAELLGVTEPVLTTKLRRLEAASGNPAIDISLIAEIANKVRIKIKSLGLDPDDSIGEEIYLGLVSLVKQHDDFLLRKFGGLANDDNESIIKKIVKAIEGFRMPNKAWVLKSSTAKRLLKQTPPKHVMKYLGYRSVDSMLKRESIYEIFGSLRFIEDSLWLDKFINKYSNLSSTDFESRSIKIIAMSSGKWGKAARQFVHNKHHNLTHSKELGTVLILPFPKDHIKGFTLIITLLIIKYINEIRLYSSFFKTQQVNSDFGKTYATTLIKDPDSNIEVAGVQLHWRIIHKYFSKQGVSNYPEIFEPHVQPEDLLWRDAEEVLYELEPALHFWHEMNWSGKMYDGLPVSFNLLDVAQCYTNSLPYKDRTVNNFRECLWNEILLRYLSKNNLETGVLKQINKDISYAGLSTADTNNYKLIQGVL